MLRWYTLVAVSTMWVCAIMFYLSYFGCIHMCMLCKSQMDLLEEEGEGSRQGRRRQQALCCEAPRESYLKSHHSRLHSAKSSWLRLQALAVVRLGTLVITEVGHRIAMFIAISEIPAVSPFDSQLRRLSAASVSLFPRPSHGGL